MQLIDFNSFKLYVQCFWVLGNICL